MRKYTETSHNKKGRKLQIVAFIANSLFSKKKNKFRMHFSNVICTKTRPRTSRHFIWKWITSTLAFMWFEKKMATVLVLKVRFFQLGPFFLRSRFWVQVWFLDDTSQIHKTPKALKKRLDRVRKKNYLFNFNWCFLKLHL